MCNKVDNNCREEKRGCKGCYYDYVNYGNYCNELLNKLFKYEISAGDLINIAKLLKEFIISKYHCKIDRTLFRTEEIILEVSFTRFMLKYKF